MDLRFLIVLAGLAEMLPAFVLNENDPKQTLDYFIRTIGSTDPNESSVNYINGSVFGKQPGSPLKKLFNFEGYNINRKILQPDGSYLSLSREIVVYRDFRTTVIQQVWMNPWTKKANEVFSVANDPVNAQLFPGAAYPFRRVKDLINFNADIILEYPNVLTPDRYSNYSAGAVYDAAELFGYFANYTTLSTTRRPSVPATTTWIRKSQYLPWMEMSTKPGCLYYTTFAWKCNSGLSCVADDIMELVKTNYPKYLTAPSADEEPNETSWSVFKKVIDSRRSAGLPDIIIPEVNTTSGLVTHDPYVDPRILDILNGWPLSIELNGTAWSEITGKQPSELFRVLGTVQLDFEPKPQGDGYRLQFDGFVRFYNASTNLPLTFFNNPITGKTVVGPRPMLVGVDYLVDQDSLYSIDIPESQAVGLISAFSSDQPIVGLGAKAGENWSVGFLDLIFDNAELAVPEGNGKFYGNAGLFSNWPAWMEMGSIEGNLVVKATVFRP